MLLFVMLAAVAALGVFIFRDVSDTEYRIISQSGLSDDCGGVEFWDPDVTPNSTVHDFCRTHPGTHASR